MSRRFYDESFKKMAIELSYAKGAVKPVAEELGIEPSLLTKWRQVPMASKDTLKSLTEEQKEIKRLQKELKEAQLERDILKKAVGIFSKGDGRYSDL